MRPFFLDSDAAISVVTPADFPRVERWQPVSHLGFLRPSLILLAGERLEVALTEWAPDAEIKVFIAFCAGLTEISADGLDVEVGLLLEGVTLSLASFHLPRRGEGQIYEASISLPPRASAGRLVIGCGPGFSNDPAADWLAIRELVVAPARELCLARARAFSRLRMQNESAHFAVAYQHPMYQERFTRASSIDALIPSSRSLNVPGGCANAFDLAHAWLGLRGGADVPDFSMRLRHLADRLTRPPRVISLCAGTAATEAALLRGAGVAVDLCLVDIDEALLAIALGRDWGDSRVSTRVQDVNCLELQAEEADLVLCVSGAHHLVELEHVFAQVHQALGVVGELWLVGEQVGPNGNRLDNVALAAANAAFATLPEELRRNQRTGSVDSFLPNLDCAEATFEGIRSDEIEPVLSRYFLPVEVCRRNVFLWRIVGPDYVLNYDISRPEHRSVLEQLVAADLAAAVAGLRRTELHGIYRRCD